MQPLALFSFLTVAIVAFIGALVASAEEAYTTWTDATPLGLLVFAGANALAAALTAAALISGRDSPWPVQLTGTLLLLPAVWLVNESPSAGGARWLMVVAAAALVVVGGLLASGLRRRLVR